MDGAFWQFLSVVLLSLWFFGWVGTVFLSSLLVVFAKLPFHRVLPEAAAKVSGTARRGGDPAHADPVDSDQLLLRLQHQLLQFVEHGGDPLTAITFAGSAIAPVIFPWRRPDIYNASPIACYKVAGLPVITVAAILFLGILGFALYEWFTNDLYAVNGRDSLLYMGSFYVLAIAIYLGSRVYRRNQGINMKMVHSEIPVE